MNIYSKLTAVLYLLKQIYFLKIAIKINLSTITVCKESISNFQIIG